MSPTAHRRKPSDTQAISVKAKIGIKAKGGAKLPAIQHLPRLLMNMTKAAPVKAQKQKVRFGK